MSGLVAASLVVALAVAGWVMANELRLVLANDVMVVADPFRGAISASVFVLALSFGIAGVVAVSRERESGTLEILFYGPIDEIGYLGGKLAGLLAAFILAIPVILGGLLLISALTGFAITLTAIISLGVSIVPAAEVVAFGLFLAAIATRMRTSLLLFVACTFLLVASATAYGFLARLPVDDVSSPLLTLRDALGSLSVVIDVVSPFAHLERAVDSVAIESWASLAGTLALGVAYTVGLLIAAAVLLRRTGVRKNRA